MAGAGPAAAGAGVGGGGSTGEAGAAGAPDTAGSGDGGSAGCEGPVSVTGRVTSVTGVPLSGVTISVSGDDSISTTTDANGDYSVSAVCPGPRTVTASFEGLELCPPAATFQSLERDTLQDFTGSPGGCELPAIERRLLVLIYDPSVASDDSEPRPLSAAKGWGDPTSLVHDLLSTLTAATNGHVRYEPELRTLAAFPTGLDGFRYGADDYLECLGDSSRCHLEEFVDYDSIVDEAELCAALDDGDADEVWLVGGPHFGFAALRTYTSCRRMVDLVGFDGSAGVTGMLASFQSRTDAALSQIFSTGQPNPLDAFRHDYPLLVDPVTLAEPATCAAWECGELGYRTYWLRHVPRARGLDADGWLADWWRYVLDPDERRGRGELSCSPSYASGWCGNVIDGHYGECNIGEWATAKRSTGWVDFHWPSERTVEHVEIYDRACNERVLRGHLEFSDGSTPIAFGPLADTGLIPEVIDFEPKTLSGLTVVIDESYGLNPGFGEIVVE